MAEMIWWCEVTELPYRCSYEIGISSAVAHDACGNRILSAPGELVNPADLNYEAAEQIMRSWLTEDNDARLSSAVRWAVDAALGVGEPPAFKFHDCTGTFGAPCPECEGGRSDLHS